MITIKNINNLDLDNTITCGQIFRYEKELDNSYTIILTDRVVNIKYENNTLFINSNKLEHLEKIIKEYLDLDRDYISIIENIKKLDKKLEDCLNKSIGLKMIKQDPLECIISYIISQNNSVKNIQNSLNLISEKFGEKIFFNNKIYYLFPKLDKLKNITTEEFRQCKVGFRDKYLTNIISAISTDELNLKKIYNMNSNDALEHFISFKGIGMKVASCILLFAYHKFDVYPVDTWVKKYMLDNFNIEGEKNIREYTNKKYKEYSGLVIQYMFNSKRNL